MGNSPELPRSRDGHADEIVRELRDLDETEEGEMPLDGDSNSTRMSQFSVVGLGASAGGLESLEIFFANMPYDSGMAFIVVQHLSPDFKSVMDELLARQTKIPIYRVTDGIEVKPNSIYLIPPKKEMIIANGKLLLSDKDPKSGLALPIDIFFRSLAQDCGPRSIGIVLSGTGSDGSRGIRDIHEAGGLVIAQESDSAKFDGMPKSAVETGEVDLILPPEKIPPALLSYVRHHSAEGYALEQAQTNPSILEGFDAIFQLLRTNYDINFSFYKRTTVTRRVQRRLLMSQITDLEEYVDRLREDPEELNRLYKDLLIGVTKFFRDGEAFERLQKEILPSLIEKVPDDGELRIWVAGCATGEEPYSIAILVQELLEQLKRPLQVKIFATDVHRTSLEFASVGIYSEASVSEVPISRMERFFTRVKGGYRVSQELRQMIVFAPHNIIKDAPFTKIDLITCRNLLIYLETLAQKKAISLFHFALNTGGVMMMGPSESPGELAEEFEALDERWKVYRKRRDKRLPPDMRLPLSAGYAKPQGVSRFSVASAAVAPPDGPLLRAYDELLKEHAPPSLLVNDHRELIQSFGGGSDYLKMRDGRPSHDFLDLMIPDLRIPVTTAIQQAAKKRTPVSFRGIRIQVGDTQQVVHLAVKPIQDRQTGGEFFLITFQPLTSRSTAEVAAEADIGLGIEEASRDQIVALEGELRYTKENLQATVEEMETSNEELQATNEELVASNEELQSTNEELHSVNEELYTVNAEYQKKIAELTEMTADLDSLLYSTDLGVIFLDRELCIRKYTPKIGDAFHLVASDIGRRIDSFSHNIEHAGLMDDLNAVLENGEPIEREVRAGQSQTLLLRVLPYRPKQTVQGVVLTLIDISRLKQAENESRLMSKVFVDAADPIVVEDLEGRITDLNAEAQRVYDYSRSELIGQRFELLVPPEDSLRSRELRQRCLEKGGLRNIETVKQDRQGNVFPVLLTLSVLTDEQGKPVAIASSAKDITDRINAEKEARAAVNNRDQFLAMLSHELRNPLGATLTATYVLDLEPNLSPDVREVCDVIQRQTLQAARLLDDLLDVSRVMRGKIEIRPQVVDLRTLVEDVTQAVAPLIQAREHNLVIEVPETPVLVEGDPTRLLQIQENLLANAARYTAPGGEIRFSLSREDGEAVNRVKDNGSGIPPHMLERIFELFVQSDDTLDRTDGGMGLGLTLVKTLVELHGGRVSAHSDGPGKGSEFVLRLPLLADGRIQQHPDANGSPSITQTHRRIVLIEDNKDCREMLETMLRLDGHDVCTANEGQQGLDLILHQNPDVAIVDIGLPQLSGYQIAQNVRKKLGDAIYLIALTGYGRTEDRKAVRNAGFDMHLVKPLKPAELTRALEELNRSQ
ncbi:chemotaxis protein CheB [Blastopirellula marina]|uniref:PAS protein n=1 Tax=Blastopirellula marina DSM 3645 TaxID=314230 RepID=A3ZSY4_9BACT|nr:chemotaxis protein CheB [Blastopirellula marina]EAQ80410.1 PAS protein [Blastopirellula marina DSM 3645]